MASVRERKTSTGDVSYQVQIRRKDFVKTATFPTEEEARAWASMYERAVMSRRSLRRLDLDLLEAGGVQGDDLTEAEIVEASSRDLGKVSGVYFLVKGGRVVYVGQSGDVHARLAQHRRCKDKQAHDRAAVICCPPQRRLYLERHYIEKFNPVWNKTAGAPIEEDSDAVLSD